MIHKMKEEKLEYEHFKTDLNEMKQKYALIQKKIQDLSSLNVFSIAFEYNNVNLENKGARKLSD